MDDTHWTLTAAERSTLGAALDTLLPPDPEGSFPAPSETQVIDRFILRRVPAGSSDDGAPLPYPGIDADGLRGILATLSGTDTDMTAALQRLEAEQPREFAALWQLAVFGYYSQPETIAAISRDLAPAYHGAPQPLGYAHVLAPWDRDDPLQFPRTPRGSWTPTDAVTRVAVEQLPDWNREGGS